jgi:hypothetical protein
MHVIRVHIVLNCNINFAAYFNPLNYEVHKNYIISFLPHRKHTVSITKINMLMLFKEIIPVYSENHKKQ